jgi:hypothetical protein
LAAFAQILVAALRELAVNDDLVPMIWNDESIPSDLFWLVLLSGDLKRMKRPKAELDG